MLRVHSISRNAFKEHAQARDGNNVWLWIIAQLTRALIKACVTHKTHQRRGRRGADTHPEIVWLNAEGERAFRRTLWQEFDMTPSVDLEASSCCCSSTQRSMSGLGSLAPSLLRVWGVPWGVLGLCRLWGLCVWLHCWCRGSFEAPSPSFVSLCPSVVPELLRPASW